MAVDTQVMIRMIEGSECWVPVPAQSLDSINFLILDNNEFDPSDTSQLLEFLPGDVVKVDSGMRAVEGDLANNAERAYWAILFDIVSKRPLRTPTWQTTVYARIQSEIKQGIRWHYPSVESWLITQNQAT
jgi:hypothetical protein